MTEEELSLSFGIREEPVQKRKVSTTIDYCVVYLNDRKRVSFDYGDFHDQWNKIVGDEVDGEVVVLERTRVPIKSFTLTGDGIRLIPTKLRVLPPLELSSLLTKDASL